jgi:hypothetical protein
MNRFEREVRDIINPYSTAFATWWCHSARYPRLPRMITGNKTAARPGLRRPAAHRATVTPLTGTNRTWQPTLNRRRSPEETA